MNRYASVSLILRVIALAGAIWLPATSASSDDVSTGSLSCTTRDEPGAIQALAFYESREHTVCQDAVVNRLDCARLGYTVSSVWGHISTTLTFDIVPEPLGVILLASDPSGPFTPTLTLEVHTDESGNGGSPYYLKAVQPGTAILPSAEPNEYPYERYYHVDCDNNYYENSIVSSGRVQAIQVSAVGPNFLDPNPNVGGGVRIFPGKMHPEDTTHEQVRVTASSSAPGLRVSFAAFDMDDPSADDVPVDSNGSAGNDNYGLPSTGTLSAHSVTSDEQGVAQVDFSVTKNPGDNFRVAASCDAGYLNSIEVVGLELIDADGVSLPNNRAAVSDLLTVWRRLHIEVDSMGSVTGNNAEGDVIRVTNHGSRSVIYVSPEFAREDRNRFENGAIEVYSASHYSSHKVLSNSTRNVVVDGPLGQDVVGSKFLVVDDDDFNSDDTVFRLDGDDGEDIPSPGTNLMQNSDDPSLNVFAPAYVVPTYDIGDSNDQVPFWLNMTDQIFISVYANYFNQIATQADSDFWSVYLLGAYQHARGRDLDPDKRKIGFDGVCATVDEINGVAAAYFHETNRECQYDQDAVVAHEIGHLFGGEHRDGCLMSEGPGPCNVFSGKTLFKIRTVDHP